MGKNEGKDQSMVRMFIGGLDPTIMVKTVLHENFKKEKKSHMVRKCHNASHSRECRVAVIDGVLRNDVRLTEMTLGNIYKAVASRKTFPPAVFVDYGGRNTVH
jgi:hypothetical protein